MINISLRILHWLIALTLWFAWIVPNTKYKKFSLGFVTFTMITWLIFDRCIAWDIQMKFDPNFKPEDDYLIAKKLNIPPETYKLITSTIVYINYLMLGKQLGVGMHALNSVLIYGLFNRQYLHRGDDDLSKYSKAPTLA